MKKVLFVTIIGLFMATAVANAQTERGNLLINARTSSLNLDFQKPITVNLGVAGGYFVANDLAIMADVKLDFVGEDKPNDSVFGFGIGVGARYYFAQLGAGKFLGEAMVDVNKKGKADATFGVNLAVGYAWFVAPNIALEPMVNVRIPFEGDVAVGLGAGFSILF